jgi:DNA-directed RNA polymerase omega subunit
VKEPASVQEKTPMKSNIIENNFCKSLVAGQRAKQLQKGARPRVATTTLRTTTIALQEIEQGLISFDFIPAPTKV